MKLEEMVIHEEKLPTRQRQSSAGLLRCSSYCVFSVSVFFAMLGKWSQIALIAWLLVTGAPNPATAALWLGLLCLAQVTPALLALPVAGVVADILPRRTIVWNTNAANAVGAVILALLVEHSLATLIPLLILSVISSFVRVLDVPARQEWLPTLVPRELVSHAVGLMTILCNAANAIGPVLAGALLTMFAAPIVCFVNVFLCALPSVAVIFMSPSQRQGKKPSPVVKALAEGFGAIFDSKLLRILMLGIFLGALFVRSYIVTMVMFSTNILKADAGGFAFLYAVSAVGLLLGAHTSAMIGNTPFRLRLWGISGILLGMCVMILGICEDRLDAMPWVMLAGYATAIFVGTSNILIQLNVPTHLRGKASAAHAVLISACVPFGSLLFGLTAQIFDVRIMYLACGALYAIAHVGVWAMSERCVPNRLEEN